MAIPVYTPKIDVRLFKMIGRRTTEVVAERWSAMPRSIDLTPYLGEAGTVQTVKDLRSPAGGFEISFADREYPDGRDSLAAIVEPMDMVEIRAARQPEQYASSTLPLIMRGFVSQVRRAEGIAEDGTPKRTVSIAGQDTGKLWMIHQVISQLANLERPLLTTFQLLAALGIEARVMSAKEFMTALVDQVINKKIATLSAFADAQVRPFTTADITVAEGQIIPAQAAAIRQGPIWNIVEEFADRPWNEVFVEDREDGPAFVFRPAPYKGLDGAFIMPGAADPGTVALDEAAVVTLTMQRSDARVANIFWVPPGSSLLETNLLTGVAAFNQGQPLDFDYGNNRPELYGARMMQVATRLLPDSIVRPVVQLPPEEQQQAGTAYVRWHEERGRLLKLANRDNAALEEGHAVVMGRETLKPGRYLRLTRGGLVSEAYIGRVSHSFAPLQTWTSTLHLERGTGFVERTKKEGSPYLAEGRSGVYD